MLTFGRTPEPMRLILVPGDPFVCEIEIVDGDPFTTPPVLEFDGGSTHAAELVSPTIVRWSVSAADVDLAIALPTRTARITLGDYVWFKGEFEVVG